MKIVASTGFSRKFRKLRKRHPKIKKTIETKLKLFVLDPLHPSLRLHKITGGKESAWSISLKRDLRVLFVYKKGIVILVDIGSHDEVY